MRLNVTTRDKTYNVNVTGTCTMAGNWRRENDHYLSRNYSLSSTLWIQNCEIDRRLALHDIRSYQKALDTLTDITFRVKL